MFKRHPYKRTYRWSPDIACSVGLMASDGWLGRDGRHLSLTSVDLEQVNNFVQAIEKQVKIAVKKSGAGRPAFHAQFSDVAYYDFLVAIGLTPVKSKTMPALNIPDHYYADFLRGLFDGDGTTYAYMDPRWRSSYMYYTGFLSASLQFLLYIQSSNIKCAGVGKGMLNRAGSIYSLRYAKSDSYKLASYMYYSRQLLSLTRKRTKLWGFIKEDEAVTISKNARVVKLVDSHP